MNSLVLHSAEERGAEEDKRSSRHKEENIVLRWRWEWEAREEGGMCKSSQIASTFCERVGFTKEGGNCSRWDRVRGGEDITVVCVDDDECNFFFCSCPTETSSLPPLPQLC